MFRILAVATIIQPTQYMGECEWFFFFCMKFYFTFGVFFSSLNVECYCCSCCCFFSFLWMYLLYCSIFFHWVDILLLWIAHFSLIFALGCVWPTKIYISLITISNIYIYISIYIYREIFLSNNKIYNNNKNKNIFKEKHFKCWNNCKNNNKKRRKSFEITVNYKKNLKFLKIKQKNTTVI